MNEFQFAGAKWWKFDFHTHTPESMDFKDREMSPEMWLKAFMEKEIDCVAITDHNSGGWIDCLKQTLKELQEDSPQWFRPIYLFPGVEISTYDDVHVLAIFGCDKDESHIDKLLGAIDYSGTKGDSDDVTSKNIAKVIDEITKRDGIPIPAHVDKAKGLFQIQPKRLKKVLKNKKIYAMELHDSCSIKPQVYTEAKVGWTQVTGSDTHDVNADDFGTFTWIKMDNPSLVGLEIALQDGDVSVNRDMNDNPNKRPPYFIEKLEISKAKYIGRGETLKCNFSPFLNAIIGGRGTGKSTLLEFIRFVMRRDKDLRSPHVPETLEKDSLKYFTSEENDSLLLTDSKILLLYWKNNICYRLNWYRKEDYPSLEQKKDDGTWEPIQGDIRSMFPAYIYSQKQIFELARNPSALLNIIDEAPGVDAENVYTRIKELSNQYKRIENRQQELNDKIDQKKRLDGEFSDLTRQIEYIEKSGHKEVMQKYRLRQQQLNEIDILEDKWKETHHQLLDTLEKITPADFNKEFFSDSNDILSDLKRTNDKWLTIHSKLKELGKEAESIITEWQKEKKAATWMQNVDSDKTHYEQLRSELGEEGIDPDNYHLLLTQQKNIKGELDLIGEYQTRKQNLETEKQEVFDEIRENWEILTKNRQKFLTSVLQDNKFVSIEVQPFGENWSSIEKKIRDILQCPDRFNPDFEDLKKIYQNSGDKKIKKLKETIVGICKGEKSAKYKSFATRLQSLSPESMIDLTLWFPEDKLKITLLSTNSKPSKPLESGSPGERAAALLAFILSYGEEPLLLDQPEDDLDNELISDLIVPQLRQTKTKRQVIVVTHNANIVVNGDAELVLPLEIVEGQTYVQQPASIQQKNVREYICNILEGGEKAFEQRYKRIHLGD